MRSLHHTRMVHRKGFEPLPHCASSNRSTVGATDAYLVQVRGLGPPPASLRGKYAANYTTLVH